MARISQKLQCYHIMRYEREGIEMNMFRLQTDKAKERPVNLITPSNSLCTGPSPTHPDCPSLMTTAASKERDNIAPIASSPSFISC